MKNLLKIDEHDLHDLIMKEMYHFFLEVGISWLYHLRNRKKDPNGFAAYRFLLPTNRIINKIKEVQ